MSHKNNSIHSSGHAWYVTSSLNYYLLTRARRQRVIVISLCVCVCVTANRKEHTESSARIKLFARKLFDGKDTIVLSQKNANFAHRHISLVMPIHYNTCIRF